MFLTTNNRIYLFLLLFYFSINVSGQSTSFGSEDELVEKAESLFESKGFEEAQPLYSQLLSLYPKDAHYNYKYGTCLLMVGSDREQALEYINYAISKGGVEDEVYFYLGKAHHKNYDFDKAINAYKKYKDRVSSSRQKEMKVDHHIQMCENGKTLLKKFKGIKVLEKQDMSVENFYRIYHLDGLNGQLLAKPEKYMSKHDKKVNESSIMFFPENAKELYFTSYGDKGENGKDIFKVILMGNGRWSDPINLGPVINTAYDEDFVFVHPETQVIYFASTGHNTMGGYDIFKSTYDPVIANWTEVENLDFPYSTVDNDYMYVEAPENPLAFFASDRFKPAGKTAVYKVNTVEVEPELALIKGKLTVEDIPEIENATITVKDEEGRLISRVETKKNTEYEIAFHENGGTYIFNVETNDASPIHSGKIELPESDGMNIYSQELVLKGDLENQTLVIKNDFQPKETSEGEVAFSPDLLKKQSDLSINASEDAVVSANNNGSDEGMNAEDQASNTTNQVSNATNDQVEKSIKTKEEINKEFGNLKDENINILEHKNTLLNSAYAKAELYSKKAEELYQQIDQNTTAESNDVQEKANLNAAKAIAFVEIASELQEEVELLQNQKDRIDSADEEIAQFLLEDKTALAENKLDELQNSLNSDGGVETLSQKLSQTADKQDSIRSAVAKLNRKEDKIEQDRINIESEIAHLEEEKKNAGSKRKTEIEASLKNYELDLQDLDFKLGMLQNEKQENELLLARTSAKKSSLSEISTSAEAPEITATDKSTIESDVLAMEGERKPFDNISEPISAFEEHSVAEANNRNNNLAAENQSSDEDSIAEQSHDQNDFNNNEIEDSEIENNPIVENEQEEVFTEQNTNDEETAQADDVSLSKEDTEIYTIPAAKELRAEAISLEQRSEQKFQEYNKLLVSIRSLPTEAERTKAFEEAHEVQNAARKLEIQAADVEGKANKIQYLRNNARLRSMSNTSVPTSTTNMIMLLSDEAEIYYEQANKLRAEMDTSDRFTKKESNLMEALKLEKQALKKQDQALDLLDVQEEEVANTVNEEENRERARESALALEKEYATFIRDANDIRKEASMIQNEQQKDSLLAIASEKEELAQKKLIEANVIYTESKANEGNFDIGFDSDSEPKLITVSSKPAIVDSSLKAEVDENTKQAIVSTPEFKEYQEVYREKEDLVQRTYEVYQKAEAAEVLRDSLEQREMNLRSSALEAETEEEKVQLIQEAVVINSRISKINSSLDSASKIIKLRNFLIQKKEQSLEQKLTEVDDEERAEQIVLLAKVEYAENKTKEDEGDDVTELTEVEGSEGQDLSEEISDIIDEDQTITENMLETDEENDFEEPIESSDLGEEEIVEEEQTITVNTVDAEESIEENDLEESIESSDLDDEEIVVEDNISPTEKIDKIERSTLEEGNISFIPEKVEEDIFVIKENTTNYNNSKPIPIDPVLPEGVVYQVQVGAFRNPIPQDHFQGFAPLMGVTSSTGITRYTAGIFNDFPQADNAKVEIRKLGYSDAFVVAFLNGKRIPVSEARNIQGGTGGTSSSGDLFTTETIQENEEETVGSSAAQSQESVFDSEELAKANSSSSIEGTYFSIQVGVFSKPLKKGEMGFDGLLIVDQLESGLYRYHVGIFDDLEAAKQAQQNNISKDIPDSFVVAYHNGERISISQAIAIISNR